MAYRFGKTSRSLCGFRSPARVIMSTTPQPSYVNLPTLLGDPEIAHQESLYQLVHELRVAIPAVVVSFNVETQNVVVQPAVQENVFINLVPTPVNLPQLINVPLGILRLGGFS